MLFELVVVGRKGSRARAAVERLQHGRFHLQEAPRIQAAPQATDDTAAQAEDLPAMLVAHQVEVALALAQFDVLQPVELLRRRLQRLSQQRQRLHSDRRFAGAGTQRLARSADDIAGVQVAQQRRAGLAERLAPQQQLHAATIVADMDEGDAPHIAHDAHAPGDSDTGRRIGQGCSFGAGVAAPKGRRKGVDAPRP